MVSRSSQGPRASAARGRRAGCVSRLALVFLGLFFALIAFSLVTLPPRPRAGQAVTDGSASTLAAPATVRGAYHIHTTLSDGAGTPDEVAAAAARAGLQFIILTDHGDATRTPMPPSYRSGVLVIDAVEISTTGGHYAALGLPEAAPYRLAGEPRDVVEDVRRLGGFGIAAHPDSPKRELQWTGWDTPFDGVEWLNEDTEWRDESSFALGGAFAHYLFRPAETLGSLVGHSRAVLDRWSHLATQRRVVGLAAVDAHERVALGSGHFSVNNGQTKNPGMVLLRVPSYEASFRAFTLHIELPAALTGDAARDAQTVLAAIRAGHVYSTIDALAASGAAGFVATSGSGSGNGGGNGNAKRTARMGDFLPFDGPVTFDAAAIAPAGATLRLLCDGQVVHESPATGRLHYQLSLQGPQHALPAACRLEVGWDQADTRVTWMVTNPIYLRESDPPVRDALVAAVLTPAEQAWRIAEGPRAWVVEHDPETRASAGLAALVDPDGPVVVMQFALRGGERGNQFTALVTTDPPNIAQAKRVSFAAWADRPMRVSVQLRAPFPQLPSQSERWWRSIYVDQQKRLFTIMFDDMQPVPPATTPHPRLVDTRWLLFVIDTVNTLPGTAGKLSVGEVRLER
jgi:hypothetical protein